MGFFAKLFGKKNKVKITNQLNEKLSIDYSEQGLSINGRNIMLPADFSEFAFLGQPRIIKTQAGMNYAWDNLGVHCYAGKDGKSVRCFGVAMNKGEFVAETNPQNLFGGALTINGRDWKYELGSGGHTEVLTKLMLGKYSVAAEYCQFMDSSKYSVVEIQPE